MLKRISKFAAVAAFAVALGTAYAAETPVKIYILSGQSNMNTFRHSTEFLKTNYPGLEIPTENLWYVEGAYHGGLPKEKGWGVETPFGLDLVKELKEPVLLFKSNMGGTTLYGEWRPPSTVKRDGGEVGYLYNRMIRRFHNTIKNIETICPPVKERGYEIAAFVWFQGESDACNKDPKIWNDYEQSLKDLIADVRRDVGVKDLPFLNIQINNIPLWDGKPDSPKGGAIIRAAQKKVAEEDPKGVWISTSNLSKGYHYDANAHFIIGKRMAEAMLPLAKEVVPTMPTKVTAAGKAFRERTYPDTKPDVSSLKNGLIFYLPFDEDGKPTIADRISGQKGEIVGEVTHCEGLLGKAVNLPRDRRNANHIKFPNFKDPAKDGKIDSISVSFWVQTPSGHLGDAISKYVPGKGHNSMKDGWRMPISAYNKTGMEAMIDGVTEWNPNPPKPKKGTKPTKGSPYVKAHKKGVAVSFGDGVEWHHIVAFYDGPSKTMQAYVDADFSLARRMKPWLKHFPSQGIISSAAPLMINGAGSSHQMDEIAIWNRPLTDDEIKALYNNGNGVKLK